MQRSHLFNAHKLIKDEWYLNLILNEIRSESKSIVTTNGCFDLMHYGHIYSLQQANLLGNKLIVLVNSDASVKANKGPNRPIQDENVRTMQLAALECVSYVVVMKDENPIRLLELIKPDVHCKGQDYEDLIESSIVVANGGRVQLLDLYPGLSTTAIVAKMR